jgi:hypothetical protein
MRLMLKESDIKERQDEMENEDWSSHALTMPGV